MKHLSIIASIVSFSFLASAEVVPVSTVSDLLSAIDGAVQGDVIVVANGDYSLTEGIVIDKGITVKSESGICDENEACVTFTASAKIRPFILNHPLAELSGVRIENGNANAETTAKHMGGNVYIGPAGGTLKNSILHGGVASDTGNQGKGGNLSINSDDARVENCVIRNGKATSNYGGYSSGIDITKGLVTGCIITNNLSNRAGGSLASGVYLSGGTCANSLIAYNTNHAASHQGGCAIASARLNGGVLENCTIVKNDGLFANGGVDCINGLVRNCIIVGNQSTAVNPAASAWSGKSSSFVNCITDRDIPDNGGGCIVRRADMVGFVDWQGGDFRLLPGSLAVDGGLAAETMPSATDLSGNTRVNGLGVDIGAFELQYEADSPVVGISLSDSGVIAGKGTLALNAVIPGGGDCALLNFTWTLTEKTSGEVVALAGKEVSFTPPFGVALGMYDVSLEVSGLFNGNEVLAIVNRSNAFSVLGEEIYVNASAEHGQYPFATEDDATPSLEEALEAAIDGSTIIVASGRYELEKELIIEKGVTIRSLSGEQSEDAPVITRKSNANIRILRLNHENAVVCGLKITGGLSTDQNRRGGNIIICGRGGTILNMIVDGGKNSVSGYAKGGNIYLGSSNGRVIQSIIRNGQDGTDYACGGGGIFVDDGLVDRCIITDNMSWRGNGSLDGSGVYMGGGIVANSLITSNYEGNNNQAGRIGGAVRIKGGLLTGCTVVKNRSQFLKCAGIIADGTGIVANTIIAGNTTLATDQTQAVWMGKAANFKNCVSDQPISGASDSIQSSISMIGFVDFANNDYALLFSSVAKDRAQDEYIRGDFDFAGNDRISGEHGDIGAFEFATSEEAIVDFSVDRMSGLVPFNVKFTTISSGFAEAPLYKWTFSNKSTGESIEIETNDSELEHSFTEGGIYDVSVVAESGDSEAVVSYEAMITAVLENIYVLAGENEQALFPYSTPDHATSDIAEAISIAESGCTIWLEDGLYTLNEEITIDKALTIRSISGQINEDGPTLDALNKLRPIYLNNKDAMLQGLVIKNGCAGSMGRGGNVYIASNGGKVENCFIDGGSNSSFKSYGNNLYIESDYATVKNSIIRNGRNTDYGNYGGGIYMNSGLVTGCIITNNRSFRVGEGGGFGLYLDGGKLENSLVASNTESGQQADSIGGAIYMRAGEVVNCTVSGNSANTYPNAQNICSGIVCLGGSVKNTIIAGNTIKGTLATDTVWRGNGEAFFHCVSDLAITGATENKVQSAEKIFMVENDNPYALSRHSAALEAGNPAYCNLEFDLSGKPRVQGKVIDAGCYEGKYYPAPLLLMLR